MFGCPLGEWFLSRNSYRIRQIEYWRIYRIWFIFFFRKTKPLITLFGILPEQSGCRLQRSLFHGQVYSFTGVFRPRNRKFVFFNRTPNAFRWKRSSKRLRTISFFWSPFWTRIWRPSPFNKGQQFWAIYRASPGAIATRETSSRCVFGVQCIESW